MAPSPENDNTPKAPDKNDKIKPEKQQLASDLAKEKNKDAKTLFNLNDGELKALLDEAITYKNPKDREGKSKLFKDLLIEAEESERNARAASAGGSELVRYCNPSAKRNSRHRRKPSSISENMMHGGSLDNLAKEDLFETASQQRTRKSVSARQREGGSLPCNVNSSATISNEYQFIEEARKKKALKESQTVINMETESLLEHDALDESKQDCSQPSLLHHAEIVPLSIPAKFTSKATFQVTAANNVDDAIQLADLEGGTETKKTYDFEAIPKNVVHSKYSVYIPSTTNYKNLEEKKLDENGNPLHQSSTAKAKKKKIRTDKNEVVLASENVEGHRSDIINDVDKLMEFIGGGTADGTTTKARSNVHKSSKQLHKQQTADDVSGGKSGKKHRTQSKGKETRAELKKSNSLGEISTTNLEDFDLGGGDGSEGQCGGIGKVVLRNKQGHSADRPRERRSWGNVEPPPFQSLCSNASMENLETAEKWVVTKTKKKSKKRRNSISSSRRQNSTSESDKKSHHNRSCTSPDLRRKSACSVPHSEKSNDSSDADSVHSLPIDGLNVPISYADIAKNREKKLNNNNTPEKQEKVPNKERSPTVNASPGCKSGATTIAEEVKVDTKAKPVYLQNIQTIYVEKQNVPITTNLVLNPVVKNNVPPDVHNIKSFPAISSAGGVGGVGKGLSNVEKTNNSKNAGAAVQHQQSKVKNVSGGGVNKVAKTVNNVGGGCGKNVGTTHGNTHHIDIQTDLSIIQANEKDSNQYNAQMLPPDIPDVQTIEKLQMSQHHQQLHQPPPPYHNMHQHPAHKQPHMHPHHHHHQPQQQHQHHHHQLQQQPPPHHYPQYPQQFQQGNSPPVVANHYANHFYLPSPPTYVEHNKLNNQPTANNVSTEVAPLSQQQTLMLLVDNTAPPAAAEVDPANVTNTVICSSSDNSCNSSSVNNNCDTSERTNVGEEETIVEGEDAEVMEEMMDDVDEDGRESPPPVVILSGLGNKEVSGLVFGFDINEQLLSEDICENFIARFKVPDVFSSLSHNHDKIVNFIGMAWEDIILNQSNNKVQYYSDNL